MEDDSMCWGHVKCVNVEGYFRVYFSVLDEENGGL